jgi:hypothetical protein
VVVDNYSSVMQGLLADLPLEDGGDDDHVVLTRQFAQELR